MDGGRKVLLTWTHRSCSSVRFFFFPHSEGQHQFHNEWRGVSLHPVSSIHVCWKMYKSKICQPKYAWMVRGWLRAKCVCVCEWKYSEMKLVLCAFGRLHNSNLRAACSLSMCVCLCVYECERERTKVIKVRIQSLPHWVSLWPRQHKFPLSFAPFCISSACLVQDVPLLLTDVIKIFLAVLRPAARQSRFSEKLSCLM